MAILQVEMEDPITTPCQESKIVRDPSNMMTFKVPFTIFLTFDTTDPDLRICKYVLPDDGENEDKKLYITDINTRYDKNMLLNNLIEEDE